MQKHKDSSLWALLMQVFAAFCYAVSGILAKEVMGQVPGPEVAFVRFLVCSVSCLTQWHRLRFEDKGRLGIRGLFGGMSVALYYWTMAHLGVSVANLLIYSSPIFITIIEAIRAKRLPNLKSILSLCLTSAGVVLVVTATATLGTMHITRWHALGLFAAVCSAIAIVTIKDLQKAYEGELKADKDRRDWEIFSSFSFGGAVTALPFSALGDWTLPASWLVWVLLALGGLVATLGQLLMTRYMRAFKSPAVWAVISQFVPLFTVVLASVFLHENLPPKALLGAVLIFTGVVVGVHDQRNVRKNR